MAEKRNSPVKIKAVIFDLDGVLVDAADWHYKALNQALGIFGFSISRDEHLSVYNGLPTREKLLMMSKKGKLPEKLHDIIKTLKKKYTDEAVEKYCRPSHEKQILLTFLKNQQYRLACCSNAQKYSVENMLSRSNIDHFFELVIGNDEGYKSKPDPDMYINAFKLMKLKPDECVIVEDSPHGVQAAKSSGARVIQVNGYDEVNLSLFEELTTK